VVCDGRFTHLDRPRPGTLPSSFCSLYGIVKNDLLLKEIGTNNHMITYFWGDWLHRIGFGDLLYKVWQAEWYRKCHSTTL
jgi:hypothetical protein